MKQQAIHYLFILVVSHSNRRVAPSRIYDLVAVDKSINHTAYDTTIAPYQKCISICTLSPECFSFMFEPRQPYGECSFYDISYSFYTNQSKPLVPAPTGTKYYSTFPTDCADLHAMGARDSGVYTVKLLGKFKRDVYCVMDRYGGGWMAFQRRFDGSVVFHDKKWHTYKNGFGNSHGEYWLGNEMLHLLTTSQSHDYMVEATSFQDEINYKKIRKVVINSEDDKYRIVYDLTSIDSSYSTTDYGTDMRGMQFSTVDRDHDPSTGDCASKYGAWWLNDCYKEAMNGHYKQQATEINVNYNNGIIWQGWKGWDTSLKKSFLMIRPSSFELNHESVV